MRRGRAGHGDDHRASVLTSDGRAPDDSLVETGEEPLVRLVTYDDDWPADDPDANLKADVAAYSHLDPLATLRVLGPNTGIPVGALVRYVLARWASGGSEGVLELGPSTVRRMAQVCLEAEDAGTDDARLRAYEQLRQMIGWLDATLGDDSCDPPV